MENPKEVMREPSAAEVSRSVKALVSFAVTRAKLDHDITGEKMAMLLALVYLRRASDLLEEGYGQ